MERDEILALDDEGLSRIVKLEFSRGSGNGGQKRNKSSTAVRVVLEEYGVSGADCSERSQHRNRAAALKKLRIALALKERRPPEPPPRRRCAVDSPDYPLFAARLLDALTAANGDYRRAAATWDISPSAFLKNFERDPALWNWLHRNYPNYPSRAAATAETDKTDGK